MKTSLVHLPQNKQDELKALTQIVLEKIQRIILILCDHCDLGKSAA